MGRTVGLYVGFAGFVSLVAGSSVGNDAPPETETRVSMAGEMQQWHKLTLTVDGPQADEGGDPNPFLDFRMQVTFRHEKTGLTYEIPGYFAADGDAANTSATSGNKWRAHLSPDHAGKWTYRVSFRKGAAVAISDDQNAGTAVAAVDGLEGSFEIAKTDKVGRDFRAHGRLKYVGKHHLQFAGTGAYFLKAGADAPENFLAYKDFDGDFKTDGHKDELVKTWAPHVRDWQAGDPTWQEGKGKGIIGAINYLASQGLNSFSFLTLNIEGDDRNAFPYTTYDERERIDCSRMDQWEIVFAHGTNLGMYLHFKTQEAENVNLLDDGHLGPQRKLYYRELIARFSHHLALNWNLGEEVGLGHEVSTKKKQDWAAYFGTHDPYRHHIVIHNGNRHYDLLGDASTLTGFSLQTNRADFRNVHGSTLDYLRRSVQAGKPWVVACDEPGDASHSLVTDAENPTHDNARKNALWGNLMAGGAGVEWYFGYKHPHSDLTCQDYRVRENMWEQSRIALEFFAKHEIPFWNMRNANDLLSNQDSFCLCVPGEIYLAFLKASKPTLLDLSAEQGVFEILWFNPRVGGPLKQGSVAAVQAGGQAMLGDPPTDGSENSNQDWLAIVRPGDAEKNYPPGVSAGQDTTLMLPRGSDHVTVELHGTLSDDRKASGELKSSWTQVGGEGDAKFDDASAAKTKVVLHGVGNYVLKLSASDGTHQTRSTVQIRVEPFQAKVTRALKAVDDVYWEGTAIHRNQHLKVEGKRRVSLLKFSIPDLPPTVLDAQLRLKVNGDAGGGQLRVFLGSHADWSSKKMTKKQAPEFGRQVAMQNVNLGNSDMVTLPVQSALNGDGTFTLMLTLDEGGDDVWFGSTRSEDGPTLLVTFEDPDGQFSQFGMATESIAQNSNVLNAISDFKVTESDGFAPGYKDQARRAMAINAAVHRNRYAAAETKFKGTAGTYDLVLTTLTETDGESSYRVLVAGKKLGEVKNPEAKHDYEAKTHRFKSIGLKQGDTIRVEFNSHSNGKIPEGDGFAFSRGRWRSVTLLEPGAPMENQTPASSSTSVPFETSYNVANAKKIHKQRNGIVVVEAENFDAVDHQDHRRWYLTTLEHTPNVKPDPDPNHAEGASGGAYLEILPDTRVTHSDPLVQGVSFSNQPGQCSVLYYPVVIDEPGRYYVWVRMCCTGSEDNGLHVGIDGAWPASGARLQFTGKHGQWQWDSRQRTDQVHTGVLGQIWLDIEEPGLHTIMFSMREDGFEFDKFMLTRDKAPMDSKSGEMGPPATH